MSYRFSTVQRLALWKAFGERCAYSSEPLFYKDLNIDHILPESLLRSPEDLEKLKRSYGLGSEFEINSYYNWLPVHGKFNRQKGSRVFDEATARFFLAMAKDNYQRTIELETEYSRLINRDDVLVPLGAAIESGILSTSEAIEYVRGLTEEERFLLLKDLTFIERAVSDSVVRKDAEKLRQMPVQHGDPSERGLLLTNGLGLERRVTTCAEHQAAKSNGFYASTTYAMKMESFFNETCGVIDALSRARAPQRSHLRRPHVGIHDLHLLPVSVLARMKDDPDLTAAALDGATVQDWVDEGRVFIKGASQYSIHLEHQMGQVLMELLRADFNGDGIEEILVSSYDYAIGGSHGYGYVLELTRLSEESLFSVVE